MATIEKPKTMREFAALIAKIIRDNQDKYVKIEEQISKDFVGDGGKPMVCSVGLVYDVLWQTEPDFKTDWSMPVSQATTDPAIEAIVAYLDGEYADYASSFLDEVTHINGELLEYEDDEGLNERPTTFEEVAAEIERRYVKERPMNDAEFVDSIDR